MLIPEPKALSIRIPKWQREWLGEKANSNFASINQEVVKALESVYRREMEQAKAEKANKGATR
jgi:hypothetical protein